MQHARLANLRSVADIREAGRPMSKLERRARWADVLARDPDRRLRPLYRVEAYARTERRQLRGDNSPLALAFADPILRDEGLEGDRLGDGGGFFGFGDGIIHALVCDCRYGGRMTAGDVARRLRGLSHPNPLVRLVARLRL